MRSAKGVGIAYLVRREEARERLNKRILGSLLGLVIAAAVMVGEYRLYSVGFDNGQHSVIQSLGEFSKRHPIMHCELSPEGDFGCEGVAVESEQEGPAMSRAGTLVQGNTVVNDGQR